MTTRFYELPPELAGDVKQFDEDIAAFRKGDIHPTQFKGIRVAHGIYEQRKFETHMVRIRCPGGQITPAQMRRVSELSHRYGAPHFHATTRSDVQLHYVDIEDIIPVYDGLIEVGLAPRGGGGNTIRNIMASHDSGIAPDEAFDVAPYASALTSRLIAEEDSWNLPRKFKIAFSNTMADNANATITCLGFIAEMKDGQRGFKVYVGGGMGAKPILGKMLYDWVPDGEVYYIAYAIKVLFDRIGDRRHKYQSRFKFVVDKHGVDEVRTMIEAERAKLEPGLELVLDEIPNAAPAEIDLAPEAATGEGFDTWKSRYVRAQKQDGLCDITVPLHLGDIWNEDGIALADFLEPFGENTIRVSLLQNLHLRNIPEAYLGNVFNQLNTMHTLSTRPAIVSRMVACTGADTCKLGICLPRGVTPEIADRLEASDLDLDALSDVKIHVSGCPNTCGRHHAADLGFFGKVMRKDGEMLPAYNIMAGGRITADDTAKFAERVSDVAAKHMPAFVEELLRAYQTEGTASGSFGDYMNNGGQAKIKELAARYRDFPDHAAEPDFYKDWGTENSFSLLKGQKAECSAGVFDMIDIDLKAARAALEEAEGAEGDALNASLHTAVARAARMLLVTRGLEVRSDDQAFTLFAQHFIESDLVDAKYRSLIEAARAGDTEMLQMAQARIGTLLTDLQALYKSMDDSLRFSQEAAKEEAPVEAVVEEADPAEASSSDEFRDFRGIGCPMNFVKVKLVLETMDSGQTLEVLLDDGEPIQNVPGSVKLEGHMILQQKQTPESHWSLVVQKA